MSTVVNDPSRLEIDVDQVRADVERAMLPDVPARREIDVTTLRLRGLLYDLLTEDLEDPRDPHVAVTAYAAARALLARPPSADVPDDVAWRYLRDLAVPAEIFERLYRMRRGASSLVREAAFMNEPIPPVAAEWLPTVEPKRQPVGKWFDVVTTDPETGRKVVQLLRDKGWLAAPVILRLQGRNPRMYFLVPAGSSRGWVRAGTVPLGPGVRIKVPPASYKSGPGVHWFAPPHNRDMFTNPMHLKWALDQVASAEASGGGA